MKFLEEIDKKCIEEISNGLNWVKSDINIKVNDLEKRINEGKIMQILSGIKEEDLRNLIKKIKESIRMIETTFELQKREEIKDVEVFKNKRPYKTVL